MTEFKIGDKVMLSPDSRWVNDYSLSPKSANPLNVKGVIDNINKIDGREYGVMWSNGRHNGCYLDHDLILAEQPASEYQDSIIEELEAKIDNLEELISEQAERIRELESLQDKEFKSVREYTLEDWAAAMVSGWEFECRNGDIVTIKHLDSFSNRPVFCSNKYYHNINGMWDEDDGEDADDIIRRVS